MMEHELRKLFSEVKAGEVTASGFEARLNEIHHSGLGSAAALPEYVTLRREAQTRFEQVNRTFERHHQLERLAKTLGISEHVRQPVAS